MTADWLQLSATVDASDAEILEDALLAAGASAVTMMDAADQPILEPELGTTPLWQDTTVLGLFPAEEDIETAQTIALEIYNNQSSNPCELKLELLENEDWTRKWIKDFKPIKFGSKLWVCPSWCEPPEPDAFNLVLDPGLAFGTGTHPTTALCLEWLDGIDLKGKTVLDYGCGSGILGIAAALLGAKKIIAIDNDPQALIATKDNAKRNNLSSEIIETYLPDEIGPINADVLVANILAAPLISLKDKMLALLSEEAIIALSGILKEQAGDIVSQYSTEVSSLETHFKEDWARVTGSIKKI